MSNDSLLKERFNKAVKLALEMETLPPDIMLEFYAYYKQATKGDDFSFNANQDQDLRSSFKYNAWMQLRGISPKQAQKEYIKLVEKYTNQKIS
ncbi:MULTISPECIES: acyl-CoA-binding protein [Wenyingzhuangia]|uniref:Acyl-CoA-binding protein n=2 Tax=Wenyingzhuangia TaxID=1518147 RepID=A0A1M5VZU7_9FLAO|nr:MULTISPECIES: acyl-CoA-binding protein [Wenyingzhuangia]MDO3694394.1 acyl-CoA-binding protein [Wenyingzhuangia sp. chi5]GGF76792.1 acyl-CoA-binding protein [Wenyingzhuangia marina]SHH80859.1 Acyl-CoA-binding protein [Wenyingzhuangia marina]